MTWVISLIQKLGAGISAVGVLLMMCGGFEVRRDPGDAGATWVRVNGVHAAAGVTLFCGAVLSAVAAGANVRPKANSDRSKLVAPSELKS
jgi:hypothetical protein